MSEDMGEKTEEPSSRKLSEARQSGNVAKSADLAAAIDMIGVVVLIVVCGGAIMRAFAGVMRRVLQDGSLDTASAGPLVRECLYRGLLPMLPVLAAVFGVAALSHFLQIGPLFTTEPLVPKLERLDPVAGLGRIFSRRSLVKTVMSCVKLVVVTAVAWAYIRGVLHDVAVLPALPAAAGMLSVGMMTLRLAIWLLALLLVIGLIDWLYQRWQRTQDLRMTKGEVKDERRSMDGDPEIKGRRLKLARQIALQRVGQSVPKADVIVTNPTHYSVAIRYDPATMRAPKVVAKGVDFLAMRIRQVAMIHEIPIVERPPLARALYAGVEVGREVSPEFYQAIAELLAYVYRLEKEAA